MLKLENLTLRYGKNTVLSQLNHVFEDGKVTAILGTSGIGKTTLLHLLSGLLRPSEGKVLTDYTRPAYVFQEPRLFPWMTALENLTAVCPDRDRALALLEELFPDSSVAELYPHQLSGGMKQRISLARALLYDPDLLLMDEPFRGLDPETRRAVSDLVFRKARGKTVIFVTHDEEDLIHCDTALRLTGTPVTRIEAEKSGILGNE